MPSRSSPSRATSRSKDVNANGSDHKKNELKAEARQKTLLEAWVEPAVSEKPSYEDHHGSPFGVVEHLQPLGEPPNAKVKSRVKSEAPRKSILGRSSIGGGLEGQETPEGTPAPQFLSMPLENGMGQPTIVIDDEKDADYKPGGKKKERTTRSRVTKRSSEPAYHTQASTELGKPSSEPPVASKKREKRSLYGGAKLKRVVEAAKERAVRLGKEDLAAAVHEIWVESLSDDQLTDLLEAILSQQATAKQTKAFQGYVRRAKKRLRDAKGDARNVPASSVIDSQVPPPRPLSKAMPKISQDQDIPAIPSTEKIELPPKAKLCLKTSSLPKVSKDHRGDVHGNDLSASPRKPDADDYPSDSSLTDLTEHDEDDMELDELNGLTSKLENHTTGTNGIAKDHAAERGSLIPPERKGKRSSADADFEDDERERAIAVKKQKMGKSIKREYPFEESDLRKSTAGPTARDRLTRGKDASLAPLALVRQTSGSQTGSGRDSRATSASISSPLTDLSPSSSRLSTPQVHIGPPKAAPRKKAKTKTSPEKKQLAGYGGLSGAGGAGRESPIGDDDNEELSENNDFCSACGGSGFLLCCDGCDRSFHFSCLDPPLNEDASELNEPWFCFVCIAKRPIGSGQPEKPQRGLFAPLLNGLKKRNPSNFALPQYIRDYYEGVQTDKTGSFVEAVTAKTRGRPGYDEIPDYTKLKDSKGNTVLCYHCNKSSLDRRQIIQCDYCGESWHLDCLDPPLANPPARTWDNKKLHDWMCPLHADHELRQVDARFLVPRRKLHVRRPRNAKVVETCLTRGLRNNGVIDIVYDDSDESGSEFYDDETHEDGVVYKLPASGMKLDFIDKIKNARMQKFMYEYTIRKAPIETAKPSAMRQANFAKRSFAEKQLALNLAQFADANHDLDLGKDQVENLVGALIAEAPQEVVEEYMADEGAEKAKSSAAAAILPPPSPPSSDQTDPLSAEQRRELQMLQELIRRKLESNKS